MGPVQRQVLRVLRAVDLTGHKNGLSAEQIARVIQETTGKPTNYGNVSGALSGMRKFDNRNWVREKRWPSGPHLYVQGQLVQPFKRTWLITERGVRRLENCNCMRKAA